MSRPKSRTFVKARRIAPSILVFSFPKAPPHRPGEQHHVRHITLGVEHCGPECCLIGCFEHQFRKWPPLCRRHFGIGHWERRAERLRDDLTLWPFTLE